MPYVLLLLVIPLAGWLIWKHNNKRLKTKSSKPPVPEAPLAQSFDVSLFLDGHSVLERNYPGYIDRRYW